MAVITGNPWAAFTGLLAPGAKVVGTVVEVSAGSVLVQLRSGAQLRVVGDAELQARVLIQAGRVVAVVPTLPELAVEV